LFLPLIFFENSFVRYAGAFKLTSMCWLQLLEVKFLRLSFSNNDALLIKQSKYFNFDFENFISFFRSCSFARLPFIK